MKRERIEDLGVLSERIQHILDNLGPWEAWTNSKHGFDAFLQYYANEEKMHDLHLELIQLKDQLFEILEIAKGDE